MPPSKIMILKKEFNPTKRYICVVCKQKISKPTDYALFRGLDLCRKCLSNLNRCACCGDILEWDMNFPKDYPKNYRLCCFCLHNVRQTVYNNIPADSSFIQFITNDYLHKNKKVV